MNEYDFGGPAYFKGMFGANGKLTSFCKGNSRTTSAPVSRVSTTDNRVGAAEGAIALGAGATNTQTSIDNSVSADADVISEVGDTFEALAESNAETAGAAFESNALSSEASSKASSDAAFSAADAAKSTAASAAKAASDAAFSASDSSKAASAAASSAAYDASQAAQKSAEVTGQVAKDAIFGNEQVTKAALDSSNETVEDSLDFAGDIASKSIAATAGAVDGVARVAVEGQDTARKAIDSVRQAGVDALDFGSEALDFGGDAVEGAFGFGSNAVNKVVDFLSESQDKTNSLVRSTNELFGRNTGVPDSTLVSDASGNSLKMVGIGAAVILTAVFILKK